MCLMPGKSSMPITHTQKTVLPFLPRKGLLPVFISFFRDQRSRTHARPSSNTPNHLELLYSLFLELDLSLVALNGLILQRKMSEMLH